MILEERTLNGFGEAACENAEAQGLLWGARLFSNRCEKGVEGDTGPKLSYRL
jgi:hypothetical protein